MATIAAEICNQKDNTCQSIVLNIDALPFELTSSMPFDGGEYFAFSFISILSLWLLSLGVGQLLNLIKRA